MSTSSDDIARRLGINSHRRDPLAAAVQLETAMDSMRAAATAPAAGDDDAPTSPAHVDAAGLAYCCAAGGEAFPAPCPWHGAQAFDETTHVTPQLAAAVLGVTHADPLSAAEFAALVDPLQPGVDQAPPLVVHVMPADGTHTATADADCCEQEVTVIPGPAPEDLRSDRLELDAGTGESSVSAPVDPPSAFSSERRLTWRSRHDERSRDYGIRDHRLMGRAPLADILLPAGPVLDQGADGACAGFAAVDAANATDLRAWHAKGYVDPPSDLLGVADALHLYERAQQLDDVPGEDYSGTSILAAMKAGQEQGLWGGYLWAFGVKDIAQTLLQTQTAVVIGVPWGSRMFSTDADGLVTIGTDDAWQGHALAVVGLSLTGPAGQAGPFFIWQNSWGPTYGKDGLGYVHHRDLAWLLSQGGEAAIPQGSL